MTRSPGEHGDVGHAAAERREDARRALLVPDQAAVELHLTMSRRTSMGAETTGTRPAG